MTGFNTQGHFKKCSVIDYMDDERLESIIANSLVLAVLTGLLEVFGWTLGKDKD